MSKSVKLTASAATTGRKKNTPMTSRAGATKSRLAAAALTRRSSARGASAASRESGPRACRARAPLRRPRPPRQGRGHPVILLVAGQPPLQLTDVPGTRDVKGEPAAAELRPHVGDGGRREHRRPAAPEDLEVELERASEPGAREVAPASAVPQE